MASGLVSAMQDEFDVVSHVGKAMLMTWTFIGFALGTLASGPLGDNLGHPPLLLTSYGMESQIGYSHSHSQSHLRFECVFGTKYLVPSIWYQVLGTKYLVPSIRYQVLGTKYLIPSTRYHALGTKYLVPSTW